MAILCFASLLVTGLIWYLDLIVQEKKIATAVYMGLSLEKKHSELPRAYHNVVYMHPFLGYIFMKCIFYWGCTLILLLAICVALSTYLFMTHNSIIDWRLIPLATIIIAASLFTISYYITKKANLYPLLDKIHQQEEKHGTR